MKPRWMAAQWRHDDDALRSIQLSSNQQPPAPKPKRPYRAPVLHVYGDIRAITRAVGTTGLSDGGMGNQKRTR